MKAFQIYVNEICCLMYRIEAENKEQALELLHEDPSAFQEKSYDCIDWKVIDCIEEK